MSPAECAVSAQFCKALRNYEAYDGLDPGTATIDHLRDSEHSVRAWALFDMTEFTVAEDDGGSPREAVLVAQIRRSQTWRDDLATCLACAVQDYRDAAVCESIDGKEVFVWGSEEGTILGAPLPRQFPLKIWRFDSSQEPERRTRPGGRESRAGPSPGPAGDGVRGPGARGVTEPSRSEARTSGPAETEGNLERVLTQVLAQSTETFSEALREVSQVATGPRQHGGPNGERQNSTIKVEPRVPWPELGNDTGKPEEAEDFSRNFESICNMANNGKGMPEMDMVMTIGNCLKRNRKLAYDSIIREATDDGTIRETHGTSIKGSKERSFSTPRRPRKSSSVFAKSGETCIGLRTSRFSTGSRDGKTPAAR